MLCASVVSMCIVCRIPSGTGNARVDGSGAEAENRHYLRGVCACAALLRRAADTNMVFPGTELIACNTRSTGTGRSCCGWGRQTMTLCGTTRAKEMPVLSVLLRSFPHLSFLLRRSFLTERVARVCTLLFSRYQTMHRNNGLGGSRSSCGAQSPDPWRCVVAPKLGTACIAGSHLESIRARRSCLTHFKPRVLRVCVLFFHMRPSGTGRSSCGRKRQTMALCGNKPS